MPGADGASGRYRQASFSLTRRASATAALSSAVQAKKAAAAERGAALAAVKSAPKAATAQTGATPVAAAPAETAAAAPAVKRGGRTRKAVALAQPAPMPGGDAT